MAKDPAFLFYSSDFLTGVQDLTMEERGQYITLLCIQHQKGRLSRKAVALAVVNATADVMAKFKEDEQGLFYNERLEIESIKRKEHSEKQRQRAIKGWEKRKKENEATADATALPLENENENEDESKNEDEILIWPTFQDFWDAYNKKVGSKEKCEKKFNGLKQDVKEQIMNHIFEYVKATPDKTFRANPETYLNQKRWENEIINNGTQKKQSNSTARNEFFATNYPGYENL